MAVPMRLRFATRYRSPPKRRPEACPRQLLQNWKSTRSAAERPSPGTDEVARRRTPKPTSPGTDEVGRRRKPKPTSPGMDEVGRRRKPKPRNPCKTRRYPALFKLNR